MTNRTSPAAGIAGMGLAVLTASVGTSAANVALPDLAEAFGASLGQVRWVVVAYLIGMTAASVTVGALGDRLGHRPVLVAGLALFSVTALVGALAPSLAVLIVARALQGVGAAVMTALPLAIAREAAGPDRVGRTMGLLGTTSAVGTAAGPALGGLLIGLAGWRVPFAAMVPLGIGALVLVARGPIGAPLSRRPGRFDAPGTALLIGAIGLYGLALTAPADPWPVVPLLTGAALLTVGFVLVELRAAHPIVSMTMVTSRAVAIGLGANVAVAAVMMSTLVVGPFFLAGALHLTPAAIGLTMAVGPVISATTGIPAGRLVDRAGATAMVTTGLVVLTAGALALAFLPIWWGVAGYVGALIVLTPGYQLFLAANNTATLNHIDDRQRGTAAGLLGLSRNFGLITGASALGAVFTAAAGPADEAAASADLLAGALRITFLIAALLVAGAALATRFVGRAPARP